MDTCDAHSDGTQYTGGKVVLPAGSPVDLDRDGFQSDEEKDVDAVIHSAGIAHALSGVPEDDYRALNTEATVGLTATEVAERVARGATNEAGERTSRTFPACS